jgi:hypothetical protein
MRNFILASTFMFISFWGLGQKNCAAPMSDTEFTASKRSITALSSLVQRMNRCLNLVQSNCLSVSQLKELLEYFPEDADRFQLAQSALPNLANRSESYEILNSFAYFSTAFRFYDLITPKNSSPTNPTAQPERVSLNFPAVNYPDVQNYQGKKNCTVYISDADFMFLAQKLASSEDETGKLNYAKHISNQNCMTTTQVMKMSSLLKLERDRLELFKSAYAKVYDKDNFSQALVMFSHQPNRQEFTNFIKQTLEPVVETPTCTVSAEQHQQLLTSLKNQSSSLDRLAIAKNLIPSHKCYTSTQVKDIVAQFSSSVDRMEIAKFSFDYTSDTENFFAQVSPLLISQFDRRALSNFIASKQK